MKTLYLISVWKQRFIASQGVLKTELSCKWLLAAAVFIFTRKEISSSSRMSHYYLQILLYFFVSFQFTSCFYSFLVSILGSWMYFYAPFCFRPYLYIIYILCSAFLTFESFHVICRIRGMKLSHNMHSLDSSKVQGAGTRLDAFLPSECFNSLCHRFEKLLETFLNTPLLQICRLHVEDGGHVSTVN